MKGTRSALRAAAALSTAAVLALAASACSGDSGGDEDTYKVAVVNSSGGAFASGNQAGVDGIEYAIKLINADGGIDGHKVEAVPGDLQGDPANGTTLVPKVAGENVLAILGPVASAEVEIAFAVANKLEIPSISPGAGRPGVLEAARPFGWSLAQADVEVTTPVLAKAIADNGFKTAAMIGDSVNATTAVQVPMFEDLFAQTGVDLVEKQEFSTGDSSFASQVTAIKAADPDAIALAAGPDDAGRIATEIRSQGITVPLLGSSGLQSGGAAYIAAGGDSTEGTISAAQYDAANTETPAADLLATAQDDTDLEQIPLNFAYGFDAMNMVAQIIEDEGIEPGDDIASSRKTINEGLESLGEYQGMAGTTSFADGGTGIRPHLLAVVEKGVFVMKEEVN